MLNWLVDISPLWYLIPLAGALFLLFRFLRRVLFFRKLGKIERGEEFAGNLGRKNLIRYYSRVERNMSEPQSPLFRRKEIGDLWVEKLIQSGGTKWFRLIVRHFPGEYLYPCFLESLKKRMLFRVFQENLDPDDILTLEHLGRSCASQPFDGKTASELLDGHKAIVRKMIGSESGDVRFFAYNVLVHYTDDLSLKTVLKGFTDGSRPVRKLLIEKAIFDDRKEACTLLEHILFNDPSQSVRKAAAMRIKKDFGDLKSTDSKKLSADQALHYLTLMDPESDRDEKSALEFLEAEDKSLVREAALFLDKKGVLARFATELHLGDRLDFDRKVALLDQAVKVNVTGFFSSYPWNSDAALLAAAKLLKGRGDLDILEKMASSVFSRDPYGSEFSLEIYRTLANAIDGSGSDECHRMKAQELKKHREDGRIMEILLSSIPPEREFYYRDDLFYLLENGQDFCRLLVRERLRTYEPALILTMLNDQLLNEDNSVRFRSDILLIMANFHLDYTLQMILEHLPLLGEDELLEISSSLEKFSREKLRSLAEILFDSCDGDIHRSLIYALPLSESGYFRERLIAFKKSRDWDIRKAVLIKLHGMGELTLNDGLPMLNDPDEQVRMTAVSLLMDLDEEDVREVVGDLLRSEEESNGVKKAIILGLIKSENPGSLDLLFDYMGRQEKLRSPVIELLALRKDRFHVEGLVRNYVKAEPALREELKPLFIKLGMSMEESMASLLKDQSTEARTMIEAILEEGGYTDRLASRLTSPDVSQRIRAIGNLIGLERREALKAALMAAGDPENTVRIALVKALEKLNTPGTNRMIEELCEDPDKKVRTYAVWARERLESRNR